MPGPFKVLAHQTWIKAEKRSPLATGEVITVKAVQASSSDPNAPVANLINAGGLRDRDADGLEEQSGAAEQMWLSAKGDTEGWVEFDLGAPQKLGTVCLWNYNDTWHTDRGVRTANISVWTAKGGWKTIRTDLPIEQAEGGDGYDEPTVVTLDAVAAQKVRLDNFTCLGDGDCVGLSHVQFFGPPGPAAARPYPGDQAQSVENVGLQLEWQPGLGAVTHNVYFGTDPDGLKPLGQVKDAAAKVSRLAPGTKCWWRVDELQDDGTVTTGQVWSFETGGLVGWWKLDEVEGQTAKDSAGGHDGTLQGDPRWRRTEGKSGGALQFDGVDDSIAVPALNLHSNTATICAWVRREGRQAPWAGIVHCRDDRTKAGINFGDNDELRYHWNDKHYDWWNSAFTVPDGQWAFVALVVEPERATYYTDGSGTMQAETISGSHERQEFGDITCIGWDRYDSQGRHFKGLLDDIRVYNCSLSRAEIAAVRSGTALPAPAAEVTLVKSVAAEGRPGELVGWWKLDETEGTKAADSSGKGHDGVLHGNPQWQPAGGRIGGALALDGVEDRVEITGEWAFDLADALTVAAWTRVNRFDKDWQSLVTKGNTAWRIQRTLAENTLSFHCNGLTSPQGRWGNGIEGTRNVNDGEWHHAVAVYDGTALSLYIDGVLDSSGPATGHIQSNDAPVLLGNNSDERNREWNGLIDDVAVFGYALTGEEVAALYAGKDPMAVVALRDTGAAAGPALASTGGPATAPPAQVSADSAAAAPAPQAEPAPQVEAASAPQPAPDAGPAGPQAAAEARTHVGLSLWVVLAIVAVVAVIAGVSALAGKEQSS